MRTTTKLGLKVWDQPSDNLDPDDWEFNWDQLEARTKWTQAGSIAIAQGSYTSTALGGQTILHKDGTITFGTAFSSTPIVTATTSLNGVNVVITASSTTTATAKVWTLRNDSASFGTVTVYWHAVLA